MTYFNGLVVFSRPHQAHHLHGNFMSDLTPTSVTSRVIDSFEFALLSLVCSLTNSPKLFPALLLLPSPLGYRSACYPLEPGFVPFPPLPFHPAHWFLYTQQGNSGYPTALGIAPPDHTNAGDSQGDSKCCWTLNSFFSTDTQGSVGIRMYAFVPEPLATTLPLETL